ncbi:MAG TPA: hypothetical protein VH186_37340 [Chloroflexia bacterium]|nr:hypothetical protein [Chloroflexia bacterium]
MLDQHNVPGNGSSSRRGPLVGFGLSFTIFLVLYLIISFIVMSMGSWSKDVISGVMVGFIIATLLFCSIYFWMDNRASHHHS